MEITTIDKVDLTIYTYVVCTCMKDSGECLTVPRIGYPHVAVVRCPRCGTELKTFVEQI